MHCFGLWEYIQHENRWQLLSSGSTSSNGMEFPCQHSNISHHSGTSGQCSYLHQPFPVRPHWAWPCTSAFNQGCEECPHPKPKLLLPVSLPHTSRHLSPDTSAPSADLGLSSSENRLLPTPLDHGLQGAWVDGAHSCFPLFKDHRSALPTVQW